MSKNIIMVSWDSVRADHMPFHGYDRQNAQTLNKIAKDGTVFENAYVPGVGTPTSFTGILTGEHAHGVQANITPNHWAESNKGRRMLQEALQDEGYHTGAFHANALMSSSYGWDRGWDVFEDNLWTETGAGEQKVYGTDVDGGALTKLKKGVALPALRRLGIAKEAIHAKNLVTGADAYMPWEEIWPKARTFAEEAPEPWFLWVLLVDTHHPYCAPKRYRRWDQPGRRTMYAKNYAMRRWPGLVGERDNDIVNAYDNEIVHADAMMDGVLGLMDEADRETALVFHSDHGDELGEHGVYGHRPAMWDTVSRVPLVLKNAGADGPRVGGTHSLINLGSTVLDIAGSDERLNDRGSLLSDETGDSAHIENRKADGGVIRATVSDGWKLVEDEGSYEAYDLEKDPREQSGVPAPGWLVDLHEEERRDKIADVSGGHGGVDADVEERLVKLGYK